MAEQAQVTPVGQTRVHDGTEALTPLYAAIAGSSGNITVVAGVTARRIRVIGGFWVASSSSNLYWTSGAGGTAIVGSSSQPVPSNSRGGGVVLPLDANGIGYFESSPGAALVVNNSEGNLAGSVTYIQVR